LRREYRLLPVMLMIGVLLSPTSAWAYLGPGLGAGAIAAILGVIGAVFLAIVGVVWYPLKRVLKGRQRAQAQNAQARKENADRR